MNVELIQQINDQLKEMNDLMGRQAAAMSATNDATTNLLKPPTSKKILLIAQPQPNVTLEQNTLLKPS